MQPKKAAPVSTPQPENVPDALWQQAHDKDPAKRKEAAAQIAALTPTTNPEVPTLGVPNPGTPSGNATPVPTVTTAQTDAMQQIQAQLDAYGLGSLASFAWTEIQAGRSADEVARDLRKTPEFNNRFPGIAQREKAGLPAISPAEYVSYEKTATELMRAAGLPKGFYDSTDDFTTLIASDVSPAELNQRVQQAKEATYNIPAEVSARLYSQFGLAPGSGALAAYYLDPDPCPAAVAAGLRGSEDRWRSGPRGLLLQRPAGSATRPARRESRSRLRQGSVNSPTTRNCSVPSPVRGSRPSRSPSSSALPSAGMPQRRTPSTGAGAPVRLASRTAAAMRRLSAASRDWAAPTRSNHLLAYRCEQRHDVTTRRSAQRCSD